MPKYEVTCSWIVDTGDDVYEDDDTWELVKGLSWDDAVIDVEEVSA